MTKLEPARRSSEASRPAGAPGKAPPGKRGADRAPSPGDTPRFLMARGTPDAVAALAGRTAGGAAMPAALRAPLEARLGASLAAARLHQGPAVTAGLHALGAPAAALGRHVFLADTAPAALLPQVLRHELAHVVQARLAEPDPGRPLRLGERGERIERQASRIAAGGPLGAPFAADANTLHRYDWAGAEGAGMGEWQDWQAELEAERETWRGAVAARAPAEVAARPKSLEAAIEESKTSLLLQRGALFEALQRQQAMGSFLLGWAGYQPIVPRTCSSAGSRPSRRSSPWRRRAADPTRSRSGRSRAAA